ncbi:MAG: hypothetical protein JRG76_04800 [Deltaproteobacteria bacterium]|nr:hypothetical protein [Deltaproteobacteria bacterium]MBW2413811.1 hypothetical protein [Deltaproteobacteria bacterium]
MRDSRLPLLCLLIGLQTIALACQTAAPQAPLEPDADQALTLIVARLQMHLRDDPYRVQPALADNGQTVFELAYWRLGRLQQSRRSAAQTRGEIDVVLQFARARAAERMRRYSEAALAYEDAADSDSILAGPAREAAAWMRTFETHARELETADDRDAELEQLEVRIEAWRALAREHADTPYAPLARLEAESWEMLRLETLAGTRDIELAIAASRRLVERHRGSRLLAQHLIRLGDLYAEAARREYLRHRARTRPLDVERYDGLLERAFASYELAMDERRPAMRREARTKIEALLAYHDGVRAHVR